MEREKMREPEPKVKAESHYDQQKTTWQKWVDEARATRKVTAKAKDLRLEPSARRGTRQAMAIGGPDFPSYVLDARVVEIPPGGHTSTHRHVSDAVIFIEKGKGYSIIGGQRYDWGERDSLHLPSWTWHQHWNLDPMLPARYLAVSTEPLMREMNIERLEDLGDAPYTPKD